MLHRETLSEAEEGRELSTIIHLSLLPAWGYNVTSCPTSSYHAFPTMMDRTLSLGAISYLFSLLWLLLGMRKATKTGFFTKPSARSGLSAVVLDPGLEAMTP